MTANHTDYSIRQAFDPASGARMGSSEIRENFHIGNLFTPGSIKLTYTHYDRMIIGGAVPTTSALDLETIKPTGTPDFLDRREMIAVNVGGKGWIEADGDRYSLDTRDMLYVGMGAKDVKFAGDGAKYYLLSAPAHASHPTTLIKQSDAKRLDLGSQETANERSIFQFVNADSVKTCQLVVGLTSFAPGSVWNTLPAHVHDRRMEVYLYFGMQAATRIFHFMGEPGETRHVVLKNHEAVLSPGWSIHSGAGTGRYAFIWAMAGDNMSFTDMDKVPMESLR